MKYGAKTIALFLSLAAGLLHTGCASKGSNLRRYSEKFTLTAIPLTNAASLSPPSANVASVGSVLFGAVAHIGAAVVKWEAKKYEAESECALRLNLLHPSTNGTLLLLTRSFKKKGHIGPPFDLAKLVNLAREIDTRLNPTAYRAVSPNSAAIASALSEQHSDSTHISFCALFLVSTNGVDSMEVTMLGYVYPGLKAKNSPIYIPLTSWHRTKSTLTLSLEGPTTVPGLVYTAKMPFKPSLIKWPRNSQKPSGWTPTGALRGSPFGDAGASQWVKFSSKPIGVPPGAVEVTATLVESSSMRKTLEKLGERIADLELDDLE